MIRVNERNAFGCSDGGNGFFLDFNKRIVELYPELFNQASTDGTDDRSNFGRKWGSYQEIDTLAKGDVRRFHEVTTLPLHTCLMKLAFEIDKSEFESRQIKSKFK